ncbi:DUF6445 family protein [Roseateles violae]|uniref:DUF6445 family protein n=1 Tax=Roseateles violae TaxID=3058042 RepID=A0ABT8DNL7_9BURK|nr:DUF6445 family protein [Pelomonas sp. PFR6]MDN3919732.1 DUF6445 family protein [Pelomonas sp. PFR6]
MSNSSDPFQYRIPPNIQSVQIGEHPLVFIDDFLEDPQALVEVACRSAFTPYAGVAERKGYPGVRAAVPADYSANLTALMEPLIKLNFGVPEELALRKSECAFSLMTVPPQSLGTLQRTPHFDASTPHHMAVLLYLCGPEHGGTAFYRHKATGLQQITPENRERYLDAFAAELQARPPQARYFSDSDEHFEFLGMMPARFNRLVIYRGSLLHTACINPQRSLGSDPRGGRLTVNTFYDF